MSSKIVNIVGHKRGVNQPVMLENFETYLEPRQHDMKCLLAHDTTHYKPNKGIGNMLFVSGEKELYVGPISVDPDVQDGQAPPASLLRTFVARRNKTTGKVRLCEVRTCTLKHISQDRPISSAPITQLDERQLYRLQAKFNPRLNRKQQSMQQKRVDMTVMQDKLERVLAETVVKETSTTVDGKEKGAVGSVTDVLQRELREKSNKEAKSLRELYRAETLIGAYDWAKLTEPARQLLKLAPEDLRMANTYLENKVKAAMQSSEPESEPNLATVRCCLYMDVLAQLCGRKAYQMAKSRKSLSHFTNALDHPIRSQFMEPVKRQTATLSEVTKYTRSKSLMYYIALVFALEQQDKVPADMLHRALELPYSQLLPFGRSVGARYVKQGDVFVLGTVQPKEESEMDLVQTVLRAGKKSARR